MKCNVHFRAKHAQGKIQHSCWHIVSFQVSESFEETPALCQQQTQLPPNTLYILIKQLSDYYKLHWLLKQRMHIIIPGNLFWVGTIILRLFSYNLKFCVTLLDNCLRTDIHLLWFQHPFQPFHSIIKYLIYNILYTALLSKNI